MRLTVSPNAFLCIPLDMITSAPPTPTTLHSANTPSESSVHLECASGTTVSVSEAVYSFRLLEALRSGEFSLLTPHAFPLSPMLLTLIARRSNVTAPFLVKGQPDQGYFGEGTHKSLASRCALC